jgi:hypothetical protein
MPAIKAATDQLIERGVFSTRKPPLFELDNATWHSLNVFADEDGKGYNKEHRHVWERIGIPLNRLIEHPPNSPDFNRCVENVHAVLKRAFRKALRRSPHINTREGYIQLFRDIAEGRVNPWVAGPNPPPVVSQASVAKNFEGLPEVWKWVRDHDGQRTPSELSH